MFARLSPAGEQLFPAIRVGLDSFERALEAVKRTRGARTARLSSTVAFVARRLAPRAGSFRAACPGWSLRLDASNQPVDLDVEADAAVRYGDGSYPGLLSEPLLQDRFSPVCTPGLVEPARADLARQTLVHFEWGAAARNDERAVVWPQWLRKAGLPGLDPDAFDRNAGLSFNDEIHAVQATLAGQGIGLLSLALVADELASGALVQPFPLSLQSFRYDLVYSPLAAERPATVVLRDWVKRTFAAE